MRRIEQISKTYDFVLNNNMVMSMKSTGFADFSADLIDVITNFAVKMNFAVITNVVIKRVHCIVGNIK